MTQDNANFIIKEEAEFNVLFCRQQKQNPETQTLLKVASSPLNISH